MNIGDNKREEYSIVMEDIIEQENKIEEMNKELFKLKGEIPFLKRYVSQYKKSAIFSLPTQIVCGMVLGLVLGIGSHGIVPSIYYKNVMFLLGLILGMTTGLFTTLKEYFNYKKTKQELSNTEIQVFFFEKDLETEKEYLQNLKELAHETPEMNSTDQLEQNNEIIKQRLKDYQEKLIVYGKRVKEFYHKPLEENFKNELYHNGIDAETFEDYIEAQVKSLKK